MRVQTVKNELLLAVGVWWVEEEVWRGASGANWPWRSSAQAKPEKERECELFSCFAVSSRRDQRERSKKKE